MKDLIKDTIGKIKKQHILPQPKWKYSVRKYGVWAVFGLIVVFGGASFSAAYYLLASLDWDLYRFVQQSFFGYSLSIFPYFWAVLIGIFAVVAFFDIRKTETGYRFSWFKISLLTIGSIFVLGAGFSWAGLGSNFNSMAVRSVPYYGAHMMVTKEIQWMQPEKGFLSGTITSISSNILTINDLNKKNWSVSLNEKTLVRPMANISAGEMIKIIGSKTGDNNFQANEIRPWMGGGMGSGSRQGNGMMNSGNEKDVNQGSGRGGNMMRGN